MRVSNNKPEVSSPAKLWLSLGHSSLNANAVDWHWLRSQCEQGSILKKVKPIIDRLQGIVIPVFDDGVCFYDTIVEPFRGYQQDAGSYEESLQELLRIAANINIPVLLEVNVLEWDKVCSQKEGGESHGIFYQHPSLEECAPQSNRGPSDVARYASPYNKEVRRIMVSLIQEIASKFPEASGIVFDLRLSDRQILGYSQAALASSVADIGVNPLNFNSSEDKDKLVLQWNEWHNWRSATMTSFLREVSDAYRECSKCSQVVVRGRMNYYGLHESVRWRSTQDWLAWLRSGFADVALVEGRWTARYDDNEYFQKLLSDSYETDSKPGEFRIIPVLSGGEIVKDSNFAMEWHALKHVTEDLNEAAFLICNNRDTEEAIRISEGTVRPGLSSIARKDEPMHDWALCDAKGQLWKSTDLLGKKGVHFLLTCDDSTLDEPTLNSLHTNDDDESMQVFVVSNKAVIRNECASVVNLVDEEQSILRLTKASLTLITVDKAGFIRRIENRDTLAAMASLISLTGDPTPKIEVGMQAPPFCLPDMNGDIVHPLAGGPNGYLLLSFFPRCFTSGCEKQLSSLRDERSALRAHGLKVFAVSTDRADMQIAFAHSLGLDFSLIPDPNFNLSILYGCATSASTVTSRLWVLIDSTGTVRFVGQGINVSTHGPDVLSTMRQLDLTQ